MKFLLTDEVCDVPEKISIKVRARVVEVLISLRIIQVTGPHGTIKKVFNMFLLIFLLLKTKNL